MHAQFLEGWAPAMGSGYSVQNTQMPVSVVTLKEPNMLRGSSCSEHGLLGLLPSWVTNTAGVKGGPKLPRLSNGTG
jgi:hypothetical protein